MKRRIALLFHESDTLESLGRYAISGHLNDTKLSMVRMWLWMRREKSSKSRNVYRSLSEQEPCEDFDSSES